MKTKTYEGLDDLAKDYKPGDLILYSPNGFDSTRLGSIVGFVYTIPHEPGGRDEPALIINDVRNATLGHLYPEEVVKKADRVA